MINWLIADSPFEKFPERKKSWGNMDMFGSECSSGCESGWTLYLEHSFLQPNASNGCSDQIIREEYWKEKASEEEEEEDLSMVSDASSGPPHFIEDEAYEEDGHFSHASKSASCGKRNGKKQKTTEYHCHEASSFLDDTASSPALNFTSNNFTNQASMQSFLEFSEGFSASHFEERSAYTEHHFGFLQSSASGNRLQKNQWFEGKGMGMR